MTATIQNLLHSAELQLKNAGIATARLDAQVVLCHVLSVEKSWLLTHPEHIIDTISQRRFDIFLQQRLKRVPIAYITGRQEFYGRMFTVNSNVLIPRPETETFIDLVRTCAPQKGDSLLDIGTGSGIIAITAKLEWPDVQVLATDISNPALAVAKQNAKHLNADVLFIKSDLLQNVSGTFRFIVANLPYVDPTWQRSPETNTEPSLALFAGDDGLELIKKLINQAPAHLTQDGFLLLEADPRQHDKLASHAKNAGFNLKQTNNFTLLLQL